MKTSFNIAYVYKCEYCGEAYDSESKALACEKVHQDKEAALLKAGLHAGDLVFLNHPNHPGPCMVLETDPDDTTMSNAIRVKYPSKYAKHFNRAFMDGFSMDVQTRDIIRVIPEGQAEELMDESDYILESIVEGLERPDSASVTMNLHPTDSKTFVKIVVRVKLPEDKATAPLEQQRRKHALRRNDHNH